MINIFDVGLLDNNDFTNEELMDVLSADENHWGGAAITFAYCLVVMCCCTCVVCCVASMKDAEQNGPD